MSHRLTKDFFLHEFTTSQTAARMGRAIVAPPDVIGNIELLCRHILQPLRNSIGVTISINSGYRPLWLNTAVGGSKTSQHVFGQAADIVAARYSPRQLCERIIELDLPFDQLILEFDQWTHVSYAVSQRRQILTARVVKGKTKYFPGLVE